MNDMWRQQMMEHYWRNNRLNLAHAMWTHGHSMQVEYPERINKIVRKGYYTYIEGKRSKTNWFHFAIPTPVIVANNRLNVGSVLIRFRTGKSDAWIDSVHVYDGEVKIDSYDDLFLQAKQFETKRFQVRGNPKVKYGLGISIGVAFGVEDEKPHNMQFSSAGCDFLY